MNKEQKRIYPTFKELQISKKFSAKKLTDSSNDASGETPELQKKTSYKNYTALPVPEASVLGANTFFRFQSRISEQSSCESGNKPFFGSSFAPINNKDVCSDEENSSISKKNKRINSDIDCDSPGFITPRSPKFGDASSFSKGQNVENNNIKYLSPRGELQPEMLSGSAHSKGSVTDRGVEIKEEMSIPIKAPRVSEQYDVLRFLKRVESQKTKNLKDEYRVNYFLFLPDNRSKAIWDILITAIVLINALLIPFQVAVSSRFETLNTIQFAIMSFLLFMDIIFSFYISYYDNEFTLIIERNKVYKHYLRTWFIPDLCSFLPCMYLFFNIASKTKWIISLIFLLRLFKERYKFTIYFNELFKIGPGKKRLIYYGLAFILMSHWTACIWYLNAQIEDLNPSTWVVRDGYQDLSDREIYMVSLYWAIQTITTVGYGNIAAGTFNERVISIIVMCIGVLSYSCAVASITSVFSSMDTAEKRFRNKLNQLEELREEYGFSHEIYIKLKKAIQRDIHSPNAFNKISFLNELPHSLKVQLSLFMHASIMKNISFFRDKSPQFLAYVGPYLKSNKVDKGEYIYCKGDPIDNIYFIVRGKAAFVLKESCNMPFVYIDQGDYFGESEFYSGDIGQGKRTFTIRAIEDVELLTLNKFDLAEVDGEFPEIVNQLFKNAESRLSKTTDIQAEAKKCATTFMRPRKSTILKLNSKNQHEETSSRRKTLIVRGPDNKLKFAGTLRDIDEKIEEESMNSIITEEDSNFTKSSSSFKNIQEESISSKKHPSSTLTLGSMDSKHLQLESPTFSKEVVKYNQSKRFHNAPSTLNKKESNKSPNNWQEMKQDLLRKGNATGKMQELNKRFIHPQKLEETQFHQIDTKLNGLEDNIQRICFILSKIKDGKRRTRSVMNKPKEPISPKLAEKPYRASVDNPIYRTLAPIPKKCVWAERKSELGEIKAKELVIGESSNVSDTEQRNMGRKIIIKTAPRTPPPNMVIALEEEEPLERYKLIEETKIEESPSVEQMVKHKLSIDTNILGTGSWFTVEDYTENSLADLDSERQLVSSPVVYTKSKFAAQPEENYTGTHSQSDLEN